MSKVKASIKEKSDIKKEKKSKEVEKGLEKKASPLETLDNSINSEKLLERKKTSKSRKSENNKEKSGQINSTPEKDETHVFNDKKIEEGDLKVKKKIKNSKKTKKIKSGCWTSEMINESIQNLESKLNEDSGKLSKSKKRRIITRLSKLKKGLRGEIEIGGQIQKSIKTIKREMKQKNMSSSISLRKNSNVVCLCCRKKGHQMSDCRYYKPTNGEVKDGNNDTNSIGERDASGKEVFKCFLCGELGHTLKDCKKPRSDNSVLPFANCFRCGKPGHIVAFCPNNETGSIYPRGGSCNICGSVKHLARNCDQQISKANKNKKSIGTGKNKDKMNIGIDDPDIMWNEAMQ
ncbi:uncharacterized protein ELE39_001523 [Cryptosporidium sp. chipmunk genotype I]|uniref:uncharacterized protein n=1 Tax=Cryptosporidium sp. chipmunk genotype I TaxID=1280935 RepID=UPI00351A5EEB|nr:hypothetical protein ELE39_001523 [Cryptosporidium sp. chipmunk genotype I]